MCVHSTLAFDSEFDDINHTNNVLYTCEINGCKSRCNTGLPEKAKGQYSNWAKVHKLYTVMLTLAHVYRTYYPT